MQKGCQQEITSLRLSIDSHLYWKIQFHKSPLCFRIFADFEADNEDVNTSIGNETTISYKQKFVCRGCYLVSELDGVWKSGYYESPLGYDKVDWFVNGVIGLESEMALCFTNTKEDEIMTNKMRNLIEQLTFVDFVKNVFSGKIRDHCHLTGV